MATVYRAYDEILDVERAIKILAPEFATRADWRDRFLGEARTLAKLDHPNVVRVQDAGIEGDRIFLVMELVGGGSVYDRVLASGALSPRQAVQITMAVLSGLQAAHDLGIVHRDIKPHNVLMSAQGTPKLADFGIALMQDDQQREKTGVVMGTLAYMAPEQRTSARQADARTDLFAMACTLYAMLAAEDPRELFAQEARDEQMAAITPALHPWFERATAYKREDRFASAAEMGEALANLFFRLPSLPGDPKHGELSDLTSAGSVRSQPTLEPAAAAPTYAAPPTSGPSRRDVAAGALPATSRRDVAIAPPAPRREGAPSPGSGLRATAPSPGSSLRAAPSPPAGLRAAPSPPAAHHDDTGRFRLKGGVAHAKPKVTPTFPLGTRAVADEPLVDRATKKRLRRIAGIAVRVALLLAVAWFGWKHRDGLARLWKRTGIEWRDDRRR